MAKKRIDERQMLKKYLSRYYRAREKQAVLQQRARKLRSEIGESASEIDARIQRQTETAERIVLEIMDIIDLLPAESTERSILELRHIDCRPWDEICKAVHFTSSPCFAYYNKALDRLLAMDKVRCILGLVEK